MVRDVGLTQTRMPDDFLHVAFVRHQRIEDRQTAGIASKREIELLREMLGKAEANADHWRALAERQQALLEDKRPKEPRSLLQRLFGR